MAFREDDATFTTFENGHISNFKVPLIFRHPNLPRVQIAANATSISIIPTILDLLISTGSFDGDDTEAANHLIQQYQGQSLLRQYETNRNGRQAWNIGVINAGGALLSVASAAVPWRLVMPLCKTAQFRFTALDSDPAEKEPLEEWSMEALVEKVRRRYGSEASIWLTEAESIGRWWYYEKRKVWKYDGASRRDDRGGAHGSDGKFRKKHWWET
jgi:hypothetical protein